MDAQTIKIIQRLVLEVAGIGVLVWGLIFIFKGLTGKISFVLKGPGFGVKLANASPGVFLSLLGALMMWFSMKDFTVEKKTVTSEVDSVAVLNQWLSNAYKVKDGKYYTKVIDTVIGTAQTDHFKVSYLTVHPPETLGKIAEKQYGDAKFWKLIAVSNIGKGYFDWASVQENSTVPDKSLLEIWRVSIFYGKTTDEIVKVSAISKKAAYQDLLQMSIQKPEFDPLAHIFELEQAYKAKELQMVETPANYSGGVETIGDLSLKYYGDKTLWPLIVWTNKKSLGQIKSADDKPDKSKDIFIIHFIP
ncbi:hypothetical protein KXD93_04620 [Mucilaginibacter sp. BJC16-A38]|uniref:hypothetical protein n=1 Tax=Mucilaginibacter phenanthrenivorans TaxID=1234842 RepID=UPI002157834F|nr:hypothetical protein [Mucilaginibacter phenanthrenivorans]MCR8556909.1 hypothetical protein [Mucilaginibacter phenanthrenivorans]